MCSGYCTMCRDYQKTLTNKPVLLSSIAAGYEAVVGGGSTRPTTSKPLSHLLVRATVPVMRRLVQHVPPTDSGLHTPQLSLQETVAVEVDHGSTSAKQAPCGRVWFVRIRRGNQAVIVNTGMSRVSAEHLA